MYEQIQYFVDKWLRKHHPQVRRWQYDDNSGERSFDIFHVRTVCLFPCDLLIVTVSSPGACVHRDGSLFVRPCAGEDLPAAARPSARSAPVGVIQIPALRPSLSS